MRALRMLLAALLLLGMSAPGIHAAEKRAGLTADDRRLLAWFDTLGVEDFTHAPLVRVRYQVLYVGNPKVRHVDEPRAFLLAEKGGQFRVLFGDLTVSTFERSGTDPERDDYVGYRPVPLEEEATRLLQLLTGENKDYVWGDGGASSLDQLHITGQAVVLARYCVAAGREDLAARLLHASAKHLSARHQPSFQKALELDFGNACTWRATLALGDPLLDRHTLAGIFHSTARNFPKTDGVDWLIKAATTLEQMAQEDETHSAPSAAEFARLAPVDQARELLFQLRDEFTADSDDWPRPLPYPVPPGNGAYRQLLALDLQAVPALAEALDDPRLTRSVSRTRQCAIGIFSSTIGGLAERALTSISSIDFAQLVPITDNVTSDALKKQMHDLERDWAKTTLEQGDTAWLRARILAGSFGVVGCIEALNRRHPESVAEVLLQAIPVLAYTPDDPLRTESLIEMLAKYDTPEVNAFLRTEMEQAPALSRRLAAAGVLRQHKRPEALAAMLAEFSTLRPTITQTELEKVSDFSIYDLMRFLLCTDSPLAPREVAAVLPHSPRQFREAALDTCLERLTMAGNLPAIERASGPTRRAVEELLFSELADTAPTLRYHGNGEKQTLADVAAGALAAGWPRKYHFDSNASPAIRAAQIATIRTTFQAEPASPETDEANAR